MLSHIHTFGSIILIMAPNVAPGKRVETSQIDLTHDPLAHPDESNAPRAASGRVTQPSSPSVSPTRKPRGKNPQVPVLPWLEWSAGERVVVRYRLSDGLHDALGDVIESEIDHVTINTRRGVVRVESSTMVTGKRVPPPPQFPRSASVSP